MWPVPSGHFAIWTCDASQRHGIPCAMFQLHCVFGGTNQGWPIRYARRCCFLSTPLSPVRVIICCAIVIVVQRFIPVGPATAIIVVCTAQDNATSIDDTHDGSVTLLVQGTRVASSRHLLQRLVRGRRRSRDYGICAHATPAKRSA